MREKPAQAHGAIAIASSSWQNGLMNEHEAFLLIATPDAPAHVQETMMLIAVHGDEGSLGFVVNRRVE
ncbi:MAG: putative AlgH/UPF0301 family transcriptional regulator, partial [Polyangiales bacterium]